MLTNGLTGKEMWRPFINCMEQSPSWETDSLPADQEISRLLGYPKFHCAVGKCSSPFSAMSQMNLIRVFTKLFP
jgi:hypothetical protein